MVSRQKRTTGYAGRLEEALERGPRPMSVRRLGREVKEAHPGLRGTSYGGIRQYVDGNVKNPRIELLRAIADVLDVRWEYIAYGEGELTPTEEGARESAEERFWGPIREAVAEGFGEGAERLGGGLSASMIARTWRRLSGSTVGAPLFQSQELGRAIGAALRGPLESLEVRPGSLPSDVFDDYVLAVCGALLHLRTPLPSTPSTRTQEEDHAD